MAKMSAQDWIEEIDRAIAYRKIYGREESWKKNELNFTNDPASHAAMGPNLVFEMGDTVLSEAEMFDPEITATPTHPAGVTRAPIVESTDNYLIKKLRMKKPIYTRCEYPGSWTVRRARSIGLKRSGNPPGNTM